MKIKIAYHLNHFRWYLLKLKDKTNLWVATDCALGYPSEHVGFALAQNLQNISTSLNHIVTILIRKKQ